MRAGRRHRRRGASASLAGRRGATRSSPTLVSSCARCCSSRRRRCTIAAPISPRSSRSFSVAARGSCPTKSSRSTSFAIRRRDARGQPRLDGPHRVTLDVDDDCLDAVARAAAARSREGRIRSPVALLTYGLVHQWTSSRAALVCRTRPTACARRRAPRRDRVGTSAHARRARRRGRTSATRCSSPFPRSWPRTSTDVDVDVRHCCVAVDRHNAAIDALLRRLRSTPDPDVERADGAASNSRDASRRAHHRLLPIRRDGARAAIAARVASRRRRAHRARRAGRRRSRSRATTSSRSSLREAAIGLRRARRSASTCSITTDLLSEGLNLQEASVIVHLDLPWNPARLDQRVGRALRLGSRHDVVTVYTIAPPASAERLLRIEATAAREVERRAANDRCRRPHPAVADRRVVARARAGRAASVRSTSSCDGGCRPTTDRARSSCGRRSSSPRSPLSMRGFLALVSTADGADARRRRRRGLETGTAAVQRAVDRVQAGVEVPNRDAAHSTSAARSLRDWLVAAARERRRSTFSAADRGALASRGAGSRRTGARARAAPSTIESRAARRRGARRRDGAVGRRCRANPRDARASAAAGRGVAAVDRGVRRAERAARDRRDSSADASHVSIVAIVLFEPPV